jgi:mannose-1-phosphate guanylyltransferase
MAGGSGTRFWPESRAAKPKQLLQLVGDSTMLAATCHRLGKLVPRDNTWVFTAGRLADAVASALPQLDRNHIVGEPAKRDTAPCIGLAALMLLKHDPAAIMAVLPSDHVIGTDEQFQAALQLAADLVEQSPDRLVTFGIRPTYPAESFGYIERGELLFKPRRTSADSMPFTYLVARFREKPNAATAAQYVASGNFYWNAGIFVWKAATIVEALRAREPEMMSHLERIAQAHGTAQFDATFAEQFAAIRGVSIDYAVMEHAQNVVVIEAPFNWDDVGSWQAISRLVPHDEAGNCVVGQHLGIDTTGSIIRTSNNHLVVTLGLEDCIVVHTPDATLVAHKRHEEAIRKVVPLLESRGLDEYL